MLEGSVSFLQNKNPQYSAARGVRTEGTLVEKTGNQNTAVDDFYILLYVFMYVCMYMYVCLYL